MRTEEEIKDLINRKDECIQEYLYQDNQNASEWKPRVYGYDIYILEGQINILRWVLGEISDEQTR